MDDEGADGADDGDDDGASKALSARRAAPSRAPVARSVADAKPGEMVYVDRHGQSVGPRKLFLVQAAAWAWVFGAGGLVGLLYGAWFSPVLGVIAGVAVEAVTFFKLRNWPAMRAAMARYAACQWEEAYAQLVVLEGKPLPHTLRRSAQMMLAGLETLFGRTQQSLDRVERVQPTLTAARGGSGRVVRCQAASLRAGALATLRRFEEAWNARDDLLREVDAAAGGPGRPRGDYLDMVVQATDLHIAAEADRPDILPDDDTLHRWVRAALGRTRFGEMLVSLAWAFHRRGDDDMARHLLAEAPSRVPRWALAETSPRLHAWAVETARAWQIDLDIHSSPLSPLAGGAPG